jgi:nucleotide-binding universal stress UspA family protein
VLFGSVADRVVQRARVPVLVVPRAAPRWPAGQLIQVLVPLDGSPLAEAALMPARGLAMALRGDLHLVRVCEEDQLLSGEGSLRELAARLGTDGLSVRTHVVTGSSPSDAILRVVHDQRIGILALATHGRGGLLRAVMGSVASEALARADFPVLLFGPNSEGSRNARESDLFAAEADSATLRHS